jgi:hypothetical protein
MRKVIEDFVLNILAEEVKQDSFLNSLDKLGVTVNTDGFGSTVLMNMIKDKIEYFYETLECAQQGDRLCIDMLIDAIMENYEE